MILHRSAYWFLCRYQTSSFAPRFSSLPSTRRLINPPQLMTLTMANCIHCNSCRARPPSSIAPKLDAHHINILDWKWWAHRADLSRQCPFLRCLKKVQKDMLLGVSWTHPGHVLRTGPFPHFGHGHQKMRDTEPYVHLNHMSPALSLDLNRDLRKSNNIMCLILNIHTASKIVGTYKVTVNAQ